MTATHLIKPGERRRIELNIAETWWVVDPHPKFIVTVRVDGEPVVRALPYRYQASLRQEALTKARQCRDELVQLRKGKTFWETHLKERQGS
jgi:hypothetical protein